MSNAEETKEQFRPYFPIEWPHQCRDLPYLENSQNLMAIAHGLVNDTICTAKDFIGHDIPELFYYKLSEKKIESPNALYKKSQSAVSFISLRKKLDDQQARPENVALYTDMLSAGTIGHKLDAPSSPNDIEWSKIERFSLRDCAGQIRDYIELWHLTPSTKCALEIKDEVKLDINKGYTHYVDAIFSNPTSKCPNPLATAKVYFSIHVPQLMPIHYHVMVTYRFEGFKSMYYALGKKQIRSLDFQRFYIDAILHTKLNFYAEVLRFRFPKERDSLNAIEKLSSKEDFSGDPRKSENNERRVTEIYQT